MYFPTPHHMTDLALCPWLSWHHCHSVTLLLMSMSYSSVILRWEKSENLRSDPISFGRWESGSPECGYPFLKVILYAVDGAGTELMFSDPVSTCFFIKWWFQAVLMRGMKWEGVHTLISDCSVLLWPPLFLCYVNLG